MDFVSALSSIPSVYLILFGAVGIILLIEVIYILHKRQKKNAAPQSTGPIYNPTLPNLQNNTNTTIVVPPQTGSRAKLIVPIVVVAVVGMIGLTTAVFLSNRTSEQDLRGRARVPSEKIIEKCGVKIDRTEENPSSGDTNKYSISFYIKNKMPNATRGVKLGVGLFGCTFNDKATCPYTDPTNGQKYEANVREIKNNEQYILSGGEERKVSYEVTQSEGACGMFQIDVNLIAVCKGDEDCNNEVWDESCNSDDNKPGTGGLYKNANACGVSPSDTPTVTPTLPAYATATPTLPPNVTVTPTIAASPTITPTPVPICQSLQFYSVDLDASPANLFVEQLTIEDLKNLKAGDKINITIMGTSQTFKGQYRVNGSSDWVNLTQKRSGTNEFYSSTPYTMPSGVTTFKFEGRTQ